MGKAQRRPAPCSAPWHRWSQDRHSPGFLNRVPGLCPARGKLSPSSAPQDGNARFRLLDGF